MEAQVDGGYGWDCDFYEYGADEKRSFISPDAAGGEICYDDNGYLQVACRMLCASASLIFVPFLPAGTLRLWLWGLASKEIYT
jgi:hypothetical protein